MGEVYRAVDALLERTVAVKLLAERYTTEQEVTARFRREALAAARLSGAPHVITVFDVGEHRKRPFIVMEYVEGGSVHDRLREGRVTPDQALEWIAQAGRALDAAHAAGVVHRDVKPANLLITGRGDVVVTDFGIASTTGVDTLTLPGTVLGTAGYLSPEQARGEPATPASDRYGLAVVAFELMTGRRPFEADTAATEAFAHVNAPIPSASKVKSELPPRLDAVFRRALAKDPADRPETCAELVADLRAAFGGGALDTLPLGAGAPTRVLPPATPPPSRRPRTPLLLAALGLVLAGIVAAALIGALRDSDGARSGARPQGGTTTQSQTTQTTDTTTTDTQTTDTQTTDTQTTDTQTTDTQTTETQTTETTETTPVAVDGASLNDEGYALMQAGDFASARPPLEQAVRALRGTGSLTEAYASYNLAYTRFQLGICNGVLELLDRSENVQGERWEINRLYRQAYDRCVAGNSGDDD